MKTIIIVMEIDLKATGHMSTSQKITLMGKAIESELKGKITEAQRQYPGGFEYNYITDPCDKENKDSKDDSGSIP